MQLEEALPNSMLRTELARSLQQTAWLYGDLVADWAMRTGVSAPSSPFAPAVLDVLGLLVAGKGERLET